VSEHESHQGIGGTGQAALRSVAPASSPVTGFSHIQLLVTDVAASERWYAVALGLERMAAAEDGSYVALRHRPSKVVVVLSSAGMDGEHGDPGGSRRGDRLDHLAFAVPDGEALEAWAARLSDLGVQHPGVVDELGKPSLVLTDPDGIHIELVAPPAL
jgi:glyoxylase I family protein